MWKNLLAYVQAVLTLAKDVDRLNDDVKSLEDKINRLSLAVQRLADEIELVSQQNKSALENSRLQFKIELMEIERRLLAPKSQERQ